LQAFRDALKSLHPALNGDAALESMEKWLTLRIAATSRGRLDVKERCSILGDQQATDVVAKKLASKPGQKAVSHTDKVPDLARHLVNHAGVVHALVGGSRVSLSD